jgi:PPOX class probable FMN-dependent enzyme
MNDGFRQFYREPLGRALTKQLDRLDTHCCAFVRLSPFVVVASANKNGDLDASPRGGAPGFVHIADDKTLLLPDAPGNNRLDSFGNIAETGKAGLLFMIPGINETLRINGLASLSHAQQELSVFANDRRPPRVVLVVKVEEAFLHCAKAFMRSKLWHESARVARSELPTMSKMINDQVGETGPQESQEAMEIRYAKDL